MLLVLFLGIIFTACKESEEQLKPNIIYILADDLGYGELGCYGQSRIRTPHIDQLAANGMRFTEHYSGSPVCAPSRYVLLTGMHTGHAYIRGNDEWPERGEVWNYEAAINDPNLEGQRPIPERTVTTGDVLQQAGYKTAIVGKWGLGGPNTEGIPNNCGFDFFFGYNCQRQAHQLYPRHLWRNTDKVILNNPVVSPRVDNRLDAGADSLDLSSYSKWLQKDYAPAKMQQEVLNFIRVNQKNPFFLYYATPLPHLPLQVPQEYVDRYLELFGDEAPYDGTDAYFPHRYPHAAYAGMISYLDDQVGEIVASLKELGLYDNTLIIFSSDNGPSYLGGVDAEFFNSAGPYPNEYGRTKGFTYEGGIKVPMIAQWPGVIEPGTTSGHISAFWDVFPTLAQVVGVDPPAGIDGISFLPALLGDPDQQAVHPHLYWEFPSYKGQQAVRLGKWKGLRHNIFEGNMEIALFNLEDDATEQKDVARDYPEIVLEIENIMKQEHREAELDRFKIEQLGD